MDMDSQHSGIVDMDSQHSGTRVRDMIELTYRHMSSLSFVIVSYYYCYYYYYYYYSYSGAPRLVEASGTLHRP
jgi:hypothetical protein